MADKFILKRRLAAVAVVVTLVVVLINAVAFAQMRYITDSFREKMIESNAENALHMTNAILVNIDSQVEELRDIAVAISEINIASEEAVDTLFLRFINIGSFTNLTLIRPDGSYSPGGGDDAPPMSTTIGREKFEAALRGRFAFNVSSRGEGNVFEVYIPVYINDRPAAVVRGDTPVSTVMSGASRFLSSSDAYVVGSDGRIVATIGGNLLNINTGDFTEWANDIALSTEIREATVLGSTSGMRSITRNGADYVVEYCSLTSVEWALVTVTDMGQLYARTGGAISVASGSAILFAAVTSVFVIAAGVYFYRTKNFIAVNLAKYDMLANTDPITGGYTISKFLEETRKILDTNGSSRFAIVSIDINKFRAINDFLGHTGGNKLLTRVAQILTACSSDFDIIARCNADQFYILSRYAVEVELERLVYGIINEIEFQITEFRILLSFGVYYIHDKTVDTRIMLDRADLARRSAKKNKDESSFAFFDTKMVLKIREEKQIEDAMDKALESGDFKVYLQPKFDLAVPTLVTGAEALVRWQHGDELISPGRFIPLFERNGFVRQLDKFMFEEVCKQQKKWLNNGFDLCVISVNMSRVHLSNPNFVQELADICAKYNVPPRYLEIEITESVAFENLMVLVQTFAKLKHHGFSISIDDFGTGYSSLNMLKDLKADVIKIDRAFLAGATKPSDRASAIISHVISLAISLKMKTICEGIETLNQAKLLNNLGCNMAQGFYFARPMPISEFERRVFGMKQYMT
ncbi:hypothetical protein FACS1894133_5590 [Clostridia bacterium]|nr:hypothetical protein FACS1894133_5590 [Clostridia bacterium]